MPRNHYVLTPQQVKERFRQQGITITAWANENGYTRRAVYNVLNGVAKAHFGQAHEIAVRLGIKPSTSGANSNLQSRAA